MPLIILRDPDGITGCERHELRSDEPLQAQIERAMPGGGADCELRIDGVTVDPITDRRLDDAPRDGMHVVLVRRPAERAARSAFRFLGGLAGQALKSLVPKMPNVAAADGAFTGKDSPNNSLTGQTNVARAYQGVPDVYGFRRVWPDLIQPSIVEYIDQVKYVTEWMCVSRGKGTITAVQYSETPIGDIEGASYEVFEPTPVGGVYEAGSTTVSDVYETFSSPDVNGQEVPYAIAFAALSKNGTFVAATGATTFTAAIADGPDLDQLKGLAPSGTARVVFTYSDGTFDATCTVQSFVVGGGTATFTFTSAAWAGGPFSESVTFAITPNGSTKNAVGPITLPIAGTRIWWSTVFLRGLQGSVSILAEWWQIDDAGVEIGGTRQTQTNTYTASTYDQRYYTNKVTPSGGSGRYKIQFTRQSVQVSGDGADVAKLESVAAVRYFAAKSLPACTIVRVTTKATLGATGLSERKFNMRWARHVRGLTSSSVSASSNFARALVHVWTTAGNDAAQLDTDAMAAINAEFGEDSPLLRFDGSLDDADMSLGERMQQIAYTARCVVWRDGAKWSVVREQARDAPEMQFDYRNLAAGGESAISYAAHLPRSNDGVEVEYVDESSQSKRAYIRLTISSGSVVSGTPANALKLKMPGCTTAAQATNRAQLEARKLLYQRTTVADTALADALSLAPLSLVRWVDPADFAGDDGLQAGEVLAIDGTEITTSERLDFGGEASGRMVFTGADGRPLGAPVLCTPSASGAAILASVPAGIYAAGSGRQLGSRYAFAAGLTEAEVEAAGLYTVTEVRPAGNGTASIALAAYDSRIYDAD
jgi:hypothetical protein